MQVDLDTLLVPTVNLLEIRFNSLTLSVDELAEITHQNPQSIRNAISQGKFPIRSFKAGSKRLFLLTDVAEFIDSQRRIESAKHNTSSTNLVVTERPNRTRGRPTKREQLESHLYSTKGQ